MRKIKKYLSLALAGVIAFGAFSFVGCEEFLDKTLDKIEDAFGGGEEKPEEKPEINYPDIQTDNLSVHFLEVGNDKTGDCTLVKVGDTEVLIDAGSRKGSAETIVPYIQNYCTDGVLEYVIATHAHQDHIAGFVGTTKAKGVFESFECETIIDFSLTNADSEIYYDYIDFRDEEVKAGAKHYTALQCWEEKNGAKRSYTLAEGITMNILYNTFYEEETSDENDYSVCVLLSQGDDHYLFTGDLEKEGEEELVKNNNLPKCKVYKGGHHGSPTSSTEDLLAVIQPEIVCVCCCCGSDEYTKNVENMFPSQAFVDRVAKYTDKIYVTTVVGETEGSFEPMNGNIVVSSDGRTLTMSFTGHDKIFKDTDWFKANRTWPSNGVGGS